ncbi:MAG: hypothetical protein ACI8X5_002607 [Planctomycetota bacterium]|jgi:hypothetical protein
MFATSLRNAMQRPNALILLSILLVSCPESASTSPSRGGVQPRAVSLDCNGNGIEDAVDIAIGSSSDTDNNGVPDECQGQG